MHQADAYHKHDALPDSPSNQRQYRLLRPFRALRNSEAPLVVQTATAIIGAELDSAPIRTPVGAKYRPKCKQLTPG